MTAKKVFSVDPVVPSFVALVLAAFIAGGFLYGMFLVPPPPEPVNLQAEYCRGVADGDMGNYINIQNNIRDMEKRAAPAGLVVLLAIGSPETGQIVQSVPLIDYFPDREVDYFQVIEDACLKVTTPEQFAAFNARGPSDLTTTTTVPSE